MLIGDVIPHSQCDIHGLFLLNISPSISFNGIMGNDLPVSSNMADWKFPYQCRS